MKASFIKVLDNTTNTFDTDGPFFSSVKLKNSVCPGYTGLDDNVHYPLDDIPHECGELIWPKSTTNATIKLDYTYLNVARPGLNKNESTTYVSLPLHITNLFDNLVSKATRPWKGICTLGPT